MGAWLLYTCPSVRERERLRGFTVCWKNTYKVSANLALRGKILHYWDTIKDRYSPDQIVR